MMKLYLIGNGFDLAHDLATKYWNFRQFLYECYPEFLSEFEENYNIYYGTNETLKKEILWSMLETNLANIDEQGIISQEEDTDMGLESGDVGIEDVLSSFLLCKYDHIGDIAGYITEWINTINISEAKPKTSEINSEEDNYYVNFNYTSTLETVYHIDSKRILHIHGAIDDIGIAPVLGHGNIARINAMTEKIEAAQSPLDEKLLSICKALSYFYDKTYKDVSLYKINLNNIREMDISEIIMVGLSVSEVDAPYFEHIDRMTRRKLLWKVYCHNEEDRFRARENLIKCGIFKNRIDIQCSTKFFIA